MKHYITNKIAVLGRYQVKLDAEIDGLDCYVAPEWDAENSHIVYAVGNGNPVYVGCLDDDGEELNRNEEDWAADFTDEFDEAFEATRTYLYLGENTLRPVNAR